MGNFKSVSLMQSEARQVFFLERTYVHKECRMKEKEMRSEVSRIMVQKRGEANRDVEYAFSFSQYR